ncbi:uncharacterized protein EDB91DRAFT_508892 [Suillus paluster]|uniref:uncharacterized protein n=1 Tax=Suillus paluster TaxID=48578 RepID=UPI001B86893C|nr:uncharacterized protein EDB91DRAFT_508892 [Suillus paluster]KAG1752288.1 hypothetical protein EDB91DRAFT_508892 [Suillus paluster]
MQELGMPFIICLLSLIGRLISTWQILHQFTIAYVTYILRPIMGIEWSCICFTPVILLLTFMGILRATYKNHTTRGLKGHVTGDSK